MKVNKIFLGLLVASLGFVRLSIAQTPLDGLMMPKGEICLAIVYENTTWDRYWEGSTIRVNQNIGTFTRQMGMPMLVGGISVKALFLEKSIGKGKLTGFSNLSFSTPASNYLSDYMPFSLGFGANELGIRAIGKYELDKGPYFRASYSYLHRGVTEAERDFYYTDQA